MIAVIARLAATRTVRLVESESGQFAVHRADIKMSAAVNEGLLRFEDGKIISHQTGNAQMALRGGRVELVLRPERFLFKPLELPSRAAEFLDGVVRAQIDRLTPWSAEQAAFGCSKPTDAGAGRIIVTVAATAKPMVAPYVRACAELGARSVTVSTHSPGEASNAPAIKVLDEHLSGILDIGQVRRILIAILAAGCVMAAGAIGAVTIIGGNLQARQDDLARSIAERRAAMVAARNAPGDPTTAAERALARRKNETPSSVIVLEVLSQILPDHTYVTELRIEADKLRFSGVTADAPGLIRLIEQSRHFTGATFFAPTTRGPSDTGDRFNIQAQMEPVFSLQP
jgi:general secretion pathway protein L